MPSPLNRGDLFPEQLVPDLINKVKGKSSLAEMSPNTPIPFNGTEFFQFDFDKEVDIVGESAAKSPGGISLEPVIIKPIKFEYGARVSDEFIYGAEEYRIRVLEEFNDSFSRKIGKGFDIAAMHGFNPRTGTASAIVGNNNFDTQVSQVVTETNSAAADNDMEAAIALIEAQEGTPSGAIFSPAFRSALGALRDTSGRKEYPELAWGQGQTGNINGLPVSTNTTVSFNDNPMLAYVGDFADYFRWGYSKEIPMEVIRYGNPDNDNTAGDLKGHNQVYIRAEMYIGWGILDPTQFSRIIAGN